MTSSSLTQVSRLLLLFVTAAYAAPPPVNTQQGNVPVGNDQASHPRLLCQQAPSRSDGQSQQQQPAQLSGCFLAIPEQQPQETTAGSPSGTVPLATTFDVLNTVTSSPENTTATGDLKLPGPIATTGSDNKPTAADPSLSIFGNDRSGNSGLSQFGTSGTTDAASATTSQFGGQSNVKHTGSTKICAQRGHRCRFGSECCTGTTCKLSPESDAFECQ